MLKWSATKTRSQRADFATVFRVIYLKFITVINSHPLTEISGIKSHFQQNKYFFSSSKEHLFKYAFSKGHIATQYVSVLQIKDCTRNSIFKIIIRLSTHRVKSLWHLWWMYPKYVGYPKAFLVSPPPPPQQKKTPDRPSRMTTDKIFESHRQTDSTPTKENDSWSFEILMKILTAVCCLFWYRSRGVTWYNVFAFCLVICRSDVGLFCVTGYNVLFDLWNVFVFCSGYCRSGVSLVSVTGVWGNTFPFIVVAELCEGLS